MRLDQYLVSSGFFESRSKAKAEIEAGRIKVSGIVVTKPAFDVEENPDIEILSGTLEYVSRGGLKLEKALDYFKIDPKDKVCLDIGASTGGFTHCLIKRGAKEVYSIDVGTLQLHPSLRSNPKVHSYESTNFLDFDTNGLGIELVVIDVSFVKVETILEKVIRDLKGATVVFLIKPQFELGHISLKNGIVKDKGLREKVLNQIRTFLNERGITPNEIIESPIEGGSGNIEYLTYFA